MPGVIIVVGLGIVIGIIIGFGMLVFLTCCIRRSNRHNNGASQVGSPVYWKTRSELVYHGSDLYHCDHHAASATMSPPPPPLLPQSMHDYSSWPPLQSSDAKTTTPQSFTATMFPSPHLVHLRHHNHLLDCSGKRIDELTTIVEPSKCQQQQLDHCNALKLKRDHVYELPRVQDKVRQATAAAAITCPSGVDTQGHQGGGSEYIQRQGTCTERNAQHSLTCM